MKRQPTKAELRDEIDRQVRDYLGEGGEIEQVENGATGVNGSDFRHSPLGFSRPRQPRTPIPEVVAAIDARKQPATPKRRRTRLSPPRKKVIYDDFGEPVRWVWVEE